MVSAAAAGSFTHACAARDLQILTLIEERQDGAVSSDRLSNAMLATIDARTLCYDGHEADALRMYDSIVVGLTPP